MTKSKLMGGLLALTVLIFPALGAASYDVDDYQWCYNNMPKFYDTAFQACVDRNCDRISNKKISQKRGCYRRCTGEVVDACMAKRAEGGRPAAPLQAAPAVEPSGNSIANRPATNQAAPQVTPAQPTPTETRREDGFLSRMWRGITGGSEKNEAPSTPAAAQDAGAPAAQAPVANEEGDGKRKGFFSQLADSFGEGASNLNADYKWCSSQTGGVFQKFMRDCSRGCMAGPSASGSRRQACLRSCKVDAVDACIKARDGR